MKPVTRDEDGFIKEPDHVETYRMPLLDHLRDLRKRLITSVAAVMVCVILCFVFSQEIWHVLVAPMNQALIDTGKGTMAITSPLEGFLTYMRVAAVAGIVLASPVVFFQIWQFVAPGLYPKEQKMVLPLVIGSSTLFALGATFCYFVIFRFAFPVFLTVTTEDVQAVLSMDAYLSVVTTMILAFGICFQLPVVVYVLARVGLVNHRDLIRVFRYAMVAIFVVAALMTPGPDVLSQSLLAIPLILLYIVSIGVARLWSTKPITPPVAG